MFSIVEDVNHLAPPKDACAALQGAGFRVQLAIDAAMRFPIMAIILQVSWDILLLVPF